MQIIESEIKELIEENGRLKAEIKKLKKSNIDLENHLVEVNAIYEAIEMVLDGQGVSDFMESYPIVDNVQTMKKMLEMREREDIK